MKVTIELACLKKKENQSAHFASAWLVLSRWFFTTLVPASQLELILVVSLYLTRSDPNSHQNPIK